MVAVTSVGLLSDGDAVGVAPFVSVVPAAAGDQSIDVGGLAVFPGVDVVDLAAGGGDLAPLDDTRRVPGLEGAALRRGGAADSAAEVERVAVGAQDERGESGIEQDFAGPLGGDGGAIGEPGGERCAVERPARRGWPQHPPGRGAGLRHGTGR